MKKYLIASLCGLFSGLSVMAMEMDIDSVASKKIKEEQEAMLIDPGVTVDSLQNLCCKAVANNIDCVELTDDTKVPNFGAISHHNVEKIFKYSPITADNYDRFLLLLRWFKVNGQSPVQAQEKPNLQFSEQQSNVAALMVECLDRMQLDQESKSVVEYVQARDVLPNPAHRLAEVLVGRKMINEYEKKLIKRITTSSPRVDFSSLIQVMWNNMAQLPEARQDMMMQAAQLLRVSKKPIFDDKLLEFNYKNYEDLLTMYRGLRKKFVESSAFANAPLNTTKIDFNKLTINEFIAFNNLGAIRKQMETSSGRSNLQQYLQDASTGSPQQEFMRHLTYLDQSLPVEEREKIQFLKKQLPTDVLTFKLQ